MQKIKQKFKKFAFAITVFLAPLIFGKSALAVAVGVCIPTQNADGSFTCKSDFEWNSYVTAIYGYAIILGGTLSVLMIVFAGYTYLTSQGDTTKINSAKEILLGAILGFLILLTVRLILDFIGLPSTT